ncbi:MAG: DNA mismatch repair protein [Acidobacteria bacterium]|nr:DNA mismatch repair protein [Acidobacteriota bacterium]
MVIRSSNLRRGVRHGPEDRIQGDPRKYPDRSVMDRIGSMIFTDGRFGRSRAPRELDEFPLPDLLSPRAEVNPDPERLKHLLDLAFLGRASAGEIDRELDSMAAAETPWQPEHFADDLFLTELVSANLNVEVCGHRFKTHGPFIERVLSAPSGDLQTIRYRQAILRELEERPGLAECVEGLLFRLYRMLTLLRASRDDARLEPLKFRMDVLAAFRSVVHHMTDTFEGSSSGLQRVFDAGTSIRQSDAFGRLEALLDHHQKMAMLDLEVFLGADGRVRHLEIRGLSEAKGNPYYRRPLRRWWDRLRIFFRRYSLGSEEIAERLSMDVWQDIAPAVVRLIQLICHLELYMVARTFAASSRFRGLDVCLPSIGSHTELEIRDLFNPLLLILPELPVPTDLIVRGDRPINLVTGPNSGGKTRLLQAVGIAQVLAHCGLYAPCSAARIPLVAGLFASIVELDRADQAEGRLGTELMRLRNLFENVPAGSLVLLDELCSGTNPSEAIEIVDMVLRLLRQIRPFALVTTHFLDFADQLQHRNASAGIAFLQAEVDEESGPTFRFIPGVASTSLAVGTARRLGVTFEELERILEKRLDRVPSSEEIDELPRCDGSE